MIEALEMNLNNSYCTFLCTPKERTCLAKARYQRSTPNGPSLLWNANCTICYAIMRRLLKTVIQWCIERSKPRGRLTRREMSSGAWTV